MSELENELFKVAKGSVSKAIQEALSGYNSPLQKLALQVVTAHSLELEKIIDEEFTEALTTDSLRLDIREALCSKLGKSLVSKFGGELEKQVNQLKSNPATRAKITVAIDKIVSEL